MVVRISLFDKLVTEMPAEIGEDEGVVQVSNKFCMGDNHTAYVLRFMFEGLEHTADPEDPLDTDWPWPYSAQIIKVTWRGHQATYEIACTISNNNIIDGKTFMMSYWDAPWAINHVRYGSHDYVVVVIQMYQWQTYENRDLPMTFPTYAAKVVCVGTDNCNVNLLAPWDDETLNLYTNGVSKASIYQNTIYYALDCFENSVPPEGWNFEEQGPCGPTGNDYCPSPALIVDGSGATWAADVKVACAGWNGGGYKEQNPAEFHETGSSAVDIPSNCFFYPVQRLDYETDLMQVHDGILSIVKTGFDAHAIFNGKKHAYGIHGYGQVFVLPDGDAIITVPVTADGYDNVNHVFDDKNDIVWYVDVGGIHGYSLVDPGLDRLITVDWPIPPPPAEPVPRLFKYGYNQGLAMRILAGEIILLVMSGNPRSGQHDLLILKENLPIGWSQEWPS